MRRWRPIGVWLRFQEGRRRRPQSPSPSRLPGESQTLGDTKCRARGAAPTGEIGVSGLPRPLPPAPPPQRHPSHTQVEGAQSSKERRVCSWGQLTSLGKEKRARRVAPSLGERRLLMVFLSEESRARVHVYVCVHARL